MWTEKKREEREERLKKVVVMGEPCDKGPEAVLTRYSALGPRCLRVESSDMLGRIRV